MNNWQRNLKRFNEGRDMWCIPRKNTQLNKDVKAGKFNTTPKAPTKKATKAPQINVAQAVADAHRRREANADRFFSNLQAYDVTGTKDERRQRMRDAMRKIKSFRRSYAE
jgi:hypothetical protein